MPLDAQTLKVEHIVVLMMENRSFDHMLGYLSLTGGRTDIRGLTGTEADPYNGQLFPVFHLTATKFNDEPCHDFECVARQRMGGNQGFVFDFAMLEHRNQDVGAIMGYYSATELPVYDMLAREFCVCDAWHASVPGPTWPNRLYSLSGSSAGQKNNPNLFPPPGYSMKTVFQCLAQSGRSWRYYAHQPLSAFPRAFKAHRLDGNIRHINEFYAACQTNSLPDVAWLEPDFGLLDAAVSNDDHPPGDVAHGQLLVANVYEALRSAPDDLWSKTLLIITYDEHGGFPDHVLPPVAEDDLAEFRSYGIRVPTFLISPRIPRGIVSHATYDHTSLIKTILERFCQDSQSGEMPDLGLRTSAAKSVWDVVTLAEPRTDCPPPPDLLHPGDPLPDNGIRSDMEVLFSSLGDRAAKDGIDATPPGAVAAPLSFRATQ